MSSWQDTRTSDPDIPVPTREDQIEFVRKYPGRPGALQLEADRFLAGAAFPPLFRALGGLRPSDDVLDVGCGAGRMAAALTDYLDGGTYEGFETIAGLVEWADRNITARWPSFRFRHVDLHNQTYNPTGTIAPLDFEFPYPDASFDYAVVASVFTHMRGPEIRRYLGELTRVLRIGGRAFTTWFLLDAQSDAAIRDGRAGFRLVHPAGDGFTSDPAEPEKALGFRRREAIGWSEQAGLKVTEIHAGSWTGLDGPTFQDVIVLGRL